MLGNNDKCISIYSEKLELQVSALLSLRYYRLRYVACPGVSPAYALDAYLGVHRDGRRQGRPPADGLGAALFQIQDRLRQERDRLRR